MTGNFHIRHTWLYTISSVVVL